MPARILICDDSNVMLNLFQRKLQEAGHQVVGRANDSDTCVRLYSELKPDLVLLDITMPNKDGRECLAEIMQLHPKAKVVMISALTDQKVVGGCLKLGAKAFIAKTSFNVPETFQTDVLDVLKPLLASAS
jgi:two-component system chemotaxis response regulator CheY